MPRTKSDSLNHGWVLRYISDGAFTFSIDTALLPTDIVQQLEQASYRTR